MPLCDSHQVIQLDAIEFIDEFSEKERDFVNQLILQEMGLMQSEYGSSSSSTLFEKYIEGSPLAAQLATIPSSSALVLSEISRIRAGTTDSQSVPVQWQSAIDTKRHEDFPIPPVNDDPVEWEAAVRRAEMTIEAQSILGMNVSLAEKFAVSSWGSVSKEVSAYIEEARKRVTMLQKHKDDINAARAASAAGPIATKMKHLEKKTRQIAETNFELEMAISLESASKKKRVDN